jgi:hypothetical protein
MKKGDLLEANQANHPANPCIGCITFIVYQSVNKLGNLCCPKHYSS